MIRLINPSESRRWASGDYRDIAQVHVPASTLVQATGSALATGEEPGLGRWEGCGGELESGRQLELIRYLDAPDPTVFCVRVACADQPEDALREIVRTFGLDPALITWTVIPGPEAA